MTKTPSEILEPITTEPYARGLGGLEITATEVSETEQVKGNIFKTK